LESYPREPWILNLEQQSPSDQHIRYDHESVTDTCLIIPATAICIWSTTREGVNWLVLWIFIRHVAPSDWMTLLLVTRRARLMVSCWTMFGIASFSLSLILTNLTSKRFCHFVTREVLLRFNKGPKSLNDKLYSIFNNFNILLLYFYLIFMNISII